MKAYEYLLAKGIRNIHQPKKFYNLTIAEMIEFLEDFAQKEKESVIKLLELNRVNKKVIDACKQM
jgi:hypothetical protein